jgi:hypothetical protein
MTLLMGPEANEIDTKQFKTEVGGKYNISSKKG